MNKPAIGAILTSLILHFLVIFLLNSPKNENLGTLTPLKKYAIVLPLNFSQASTIKLSKNDSTFHKGKQDHQMTQVTSASQLNLHNLESTGEKSDFRGENESIQPIYSTKLIYPDMAITNEWECEIEAQLSVAVSGKVTEVNLLKPCRYQALNLAAIEHFKSWVYPKIERPINITKRIVFKLN